MDLLKLNNEISGLRPSAIQSRVRVIHSLTKKAEQFRKKKGSENERASNEKRAQKLMQEALIAKVFTPDEIVKFALQFDSSIRDKVLNDISIPLSAKAFARIASHPCMVEKVNEFRSKYPDWNKWIEKSLEKLGTGSRFGAKMKNGRVKAHLQQRQRVEEAIDTIRRAQMTWLHNLGKNRVKVKEEKTEGKGTISTNVEAEDEGESSDSSDSQSNKVTSTTKAKANSESSDNSASETEEDTPALSNRSKTSTDSKRNKKGGKESTKDNKKKIRPVIYEEIDDNKSESDEEIHSNDTKEQLIKSDEKKHKSVMDKKQLLSKHIVELEKNKEASPESDADSEKSLHESDESENMEDNESGNTEDDESGSQNESENCDGIDETTAKKLLKKAKRKQKVIIPRSREVEVCKFSDLLKKEQTRKNERNDDRSDLDEGDKPVKSPEKGVDPFFMTRNNDFLRIATAKREAKPEEPVRQGPKWGIEGSEHWTGTRKERRARARRLMGVPDPEGFSRRRGPPKFNSTSFAANRENTREGLPLPPVRNGPAVPDEPEELHPSWAAKRKLNIASVSFQGKKVKFDDSD